MKKLGRSFGVLLALLLLGSAVTFGAGVLGLERLNASFDSVVKQDVKRLLSITDIRRRIRSRVLAERDLLAAAADGKLPDNAALELDKAAQGLEEEAARYDTLLVASDAEAWARLREAIRGQTERSVRVLEALQAGDRATAVATSAAQDSRWEGEIKGLITLAQDRLAAKSHQAQELYAAATRVLWAVFLMSVLLGLLVGGFIYRGIRTMVTEVVGLKDQLMLANAGLEKTVEERTRTIRAILDHVQFGFFMSGADLRIGQGYTRSLAELLGRTELAGMRVSEALGLPPAKAAELDLYLAQCFEDVFPDEVACGQVPGRFRMGDRTLHLQVRIVRDAAGLISQLLYGISDVTELEAAERSMRETQVLLRAMKNPDSFTLFVTDLNTRFQATREALQTNNEPRARREIHTIKGNAGVYGLVDIAARAHQLEEQPAIPMPMVTELEKQFDQFIQEHRDVLDAVGGGGEAIRLAEAQLDELDALAARATDLESLRTQLRARLERLRWRRANQFTGPLEGLTASLAERLGKAAVLKVTGGETAVHPRRLAPILAVIPHIIRNALDHGIEAPEERGSKPEQGTLSLDFAEDSNGWTVTLADDGRGIDTARLRAKAEERGLVSRNAVLSEQELCNLIFLPSLSTATDVTDISGRGEGMAAVAEAVKNAGGDLQVNARRGLGTTFVIHVPRQPMLRAA